MEDGDESVPNLTNASPSPSSNASKNTSVGVEANASKNTSVGVEETKGQEPDDGRPAVAVDPNSASSASETEENNTDIVGSFITISMKHDREPYKKIIAKTICSILRDGRATKPPHNELEKLLLSDFVLSSDRLDETIQLHENVKHYDNMKTVDSNISELFSSNHGDAWLVDEEQDENIINLVLDINKLLKKVHEDHNIGIVYSYLIDLIVIITDIFNSKYSAIDKVLIKDLIDAAAGAAAEAEAAKNEKAKNKKKFTFFGSKPKASPEDDEELETASKADDESDRKTIAKSDRKTIAKSDRKYGFNLTGELEKKKIHETVVNNSVKGYLLKTYYPDIKYTYDQLDQNSPDTKKNILEFLKNIRLNAESVLPQDIDRVMKEINEGTEDNDEVTLKQTNKSTTKSKLMFLEELVDFFRDDRELKPIYRSRFSLPKNITIRGKKRGGSVKNNRTHKIKKQQKK